MSACVPPLLEELDDEKPPLLDDAPPELPLEPSGKSLWSASLPQATDEATAANAKIDTKTSEDRMMELYGDTGQRRYQQARPSDDL